MAIATRLYQNYVNGRFVDASGGKTLPVENPATGADGVERPRSSVEDAREAIECADQAQRRWEKLAPIERANYLHTIAAGIRKDAEHLARVLSEEQGKPLDQSRGEVNGTADYFDYTAEWARRIEGEVIPSDRPNEMELLLRQPIGVIGGIVPWNFPLYVLARKVAPALLTGNTIVVKPSEITPNCTLSSAASSTKRRCPPASSIWFADTDRSLARSWPRTRSSAWSPSPAASGRAPGSWSSPPGTSRR